MDVKDSWKGIIWFLYLLWPFTLFALAYNFDIDKATYKEWVLFTLTLIITGFWFYGTSVLIKNIKDTFKRK